MLACNTNWYKILLPTLLLVASSQTLAQTSFEITPFAGYRMSEDFEQTEPYASTGIDLDNSASYGVVFAWPFDNTRQGELLISHSGASLQQNATLNTASDIDFTYIHLGGNVPITTGNIPIYLSGGIGATLISPSDSRFDSETKPSGNLGLSTKIALTENVNFVLGGRVYATLFNDDGQLLCDGSVCDITVSGDIWLQTEIYSGISFTF